MPTSIPHSTQELEQQAARRGSVTPRHVGIILDGNRRWAVAAGLPAVDGYLRGAERVAQTLDWCAEAGIECVTLWALAGSNMVRPKRQIDGLLGAISGGLQGLAASGRWRIRPIGSLHLLPGEMRRRLRQIAEDTADATGILVNVAIAYDGHEEIVTAVREITREWAASGGSTQALLSDFLTAQQIGAHLFTAGQPDPDLVIRTSGEQRLSGFLPWQTMQSELYFCDVLWPEFSREHLAAALDWFSTRQRRHGA